MSSLSKLILGSETPDPESVIAGVRALAPGLDALPLDEAVKGALAVKEQAIADLTAQAAALKQQLEAANVPPTPTGFVGRSAVDSKRWKVAFEDDFADLANEGEFFAKNPKWDTYDANAQSTDKKGTYDRNKISVVDLPTGERVARCRLSPKSKNSSGKPSGTVLLPKLNGSAYNGTTGEKVEVRMKIDQSAAGYHVVPLTWPLGKWPDDGEIDYLELDLNADGSGTLAGFLHVQNGGTNGEGQVKFTSDIKRDGWFTIGYERVSGERIDWTVNGNVVKTVTKADLKAPYGIPKNAHRQALQFEPKGTSQTAEAIILVDWFTIWVPA